MTSCAGGHFWGILFHYDRKQHSSYPAYVVKPGQASEGAFTRKSHPGVSFTVGVGEAVLHLINIKQKKDRRGVVGYESKVPNHLLVRQAFIY